MDIAKRKIIVKWLGALWVVSALSMLIMSHVYIYLVAPENREAVLKPFSGYTLVVSFVLLFYKCPLLYLVQFHSSKASMKAITIVARCILIHHVIWVILTFVEWVVELI